MSKRGASRKRYRCFKCRKHVRKGSREYLTIIVNGRPYSMPGGPFWVCHICKDIMDFKEAIKHG